MNKRTQTWLLVIGLVAGVVFGYRGIFHPDRDADRALSFIILPCNRGRLDRPGAGALQTQTAVAALVGPIGPSRGKRAYLQLEVQYLSFPNANLSGQS